jgi:hypothetical protein
MRVYTVRVYYIRDAVRAYLPVRVCAWSVDGAYIKAVRAARRLLPGHEIVGLGEAVEGVAK